MVMRLTFENNIIRFFKVLIRAITVYIIVSHPVAEFRHDCSCTSYYIDIIYYKIQYNSTGIHVIISKGGTAAMIFNRNYNLT